MRRLIMVISLLGILFVMVSDARPIKDYLFTSSLDLIGGHGKSEEKITLTTSDISSLVFESFALVLSYAWHVETLNDIDQVHNNLLRIEHKIDSLIDDFYTFLRQQQKSQIPQDNQDYYYDSVNAD